MRFSMGNINLICGMADNLNNYTNELRVRLSSDWDDEVRRSYERYISQCKECSDGIKNQCYTIRNKCNELANDNVDSVANSAYQLCRDVHRKIGGM